MAQARAILEAGNPRRADRQAATHFKRDPLSKPVVILVVGSEVPELPGEIVRSSRFKEIPFYSRWSDQFQSRPDKVFEVMVGVASGKYE